MKKTVSCLAMIISATALAQTEALKASTTAVKATSLAGYTFAACKPREDLYKGKDAYKAKCLKPLEEVDVPRGGMSPQTVTVKTLACDNDHTLITSSRPFYWGCLPPGVMEL